ncbi:phage baseplate protein [Megasphaera sueciensis]|uniref:phage baseplate protein n=1 Tax=Megasphaera sueciensis TaxID=349094 RepID=UPI003D028CF1
MSAGNTNIKIFNEAQSATNTYSDAQYLDATQRLSGLSGGMAITEQHNKMFLQWSVMAYALAQYISSQGYDCLDSAPSAIPTNLASAINNQISNSSITSIINSMSWQKNTVVPARKLIFSANIPPGCVATVITAGTTGATEPTWGSEDSTVEDGSVTWKIVSIVLSNDLLSQHPIGSLYWSAVNTDPGTIFGGTWAQIKDKFVLAAGDTYTAGATAGEAEHILTEAELPKITPHGTISNTASATYKDSRPQWGGSDIIGDNGTAIGSGDATRNADSVTVISTFTGTEFGGGQAHNNMPPYTVMYCWVRTA